VFIDDVNTVRTLSGATETVDVALASGVPGASLVEKVCVVGVPHAVAAGARTFLD
jgi:hypothetical protein